MARSRNETIGGGSALTIREYERQHKLRTCQSATLLDLFKGIDQGSCSRAAFWTFVMRVPDATWWGILQIAHKKPGKFSGRVIAFCREMVNMKTDVLAECERCGREIEPLACIEVDGVCICHACVYGIVEAEVAK